jgi:PAS domain S-box-containing protein
MTHATHDDPFQTIERLEAELARCRSAERKFQGLVETAPDALVVVDRDGRIVLINAQTETLFGYARDELLGQPIELLVPDRLRGAHLGHRAGYLGAPGLRPMGSGLDLTGRRKDGSEVPVEISLSPLQSGEGLLVSAAIRDISERRMAQEALRRARDELEQRVLQRTAQLEQANHALLAEVAERRQAEAALRANEAKLRLVTDNMPAGMAYVDVNQIYLYHNQTFADWLGLPAERIDGHSVEDVMGAAIYADIKARLDEALTGKSVRYERDQAIADGAMRRWSVRYAPHFGANDRVEGVMAMLTDVTEQRLAEQALRQAQKMEAVGQLTGGVAHDFNNLLTVVLGNLQILANHVRGDALATELIQAASKAARRGADLNRTLLAFSRRQRLAPLPVDFNEMIVGMAGMLRRTLGETVQVVVAPNAGLPKAMADPAQLETALLNLAVNARDAMPDGGTLTIETGTVFLDESYAAREADVVAGPYVMLAVSDTGSGMTPEVLVRAFEPFFTTKETGKGSGLGLALVYGFVKQSGGHVKIYSEPGHGTTVKIYLPPIKAAAEEVPIAAEAPRPQPKGNETVLVVEDEDDVRELACRLLSGLGYRVLKAGDSRTALSILEHEPAVDLLFTDVVLPGGVNGPELARRAANQGRQLKVLYTSGYTGNAIQQLDTLAADVRLICKPYPIDELAHKVRSALDGTLD